MKQEVANAFHFVSQTAEQAKVEFAVHNQVKHALSVIVKEIEDLQKQIDELKKDEKTK